MPNLNYPDYSQGFGGYRPQSAAPQVASQVAQSAAPNALQNILSYASPIASIAGIGLQGYGAYQQNKAIEEQNELAKEIFEDERQRGIRQEKNALDNQSLNRDIQYGQYGQGEEDRTLSTYGNYAQRIGM